MARIAPDGTILKGKTMALWHRVMCQSMIFCRVEKANLSGITWVTFPVVFKGQVFC